MNKEVDVSIVVLVYNHELFISEAIRSVLEQDYLGAVEVLVADDCSSDGTRSAIRTFETHPWVRVLDTDHNMGAQRNLRRALNAARGTYVAFLEGDDYWSNPSKISRQVQFLESHPSVNSVAHLTVVRTESSGEETSERNDQLRKDRLTLGDVVNVAFPHFSSLMYRRDALPSTPRWFDGLLGADWLICCLLAQTSDIAVLQEEMSVYRRNETSTWTPLSYAERTSDSLHQGLRLLHHGGAAAEVLRQRGMSRPYRAFFSASLRTGSPRTSVRNLTRAWRAAPALTSSQFLRWVADQARERVSRDSQESIPSNARRNRRTPKHEDDLVEHQA